MPLGHKQPVLVTDSPTVCEFNLLLCCASVSHTRMGFLHYKLQRGRRESERRKGELGGREERGKGELGGRERRVRREGRKREERGAIEKEEIGKTETEEIEGEGR